MDDVVDCTAPNVNFITNGNSYHRIVNMRFNTLSREESLSLAIRPCRPLGSGDAGPGRSAI